MKNSNTFQKQKDAVKRAVKNVITDLGLVDDIYTILDENTSSKCNGLIQAMSDNHDVEKALRKFELKLCDIIDMYTTPNVDPTRENKVYSTITFKTHSSLEDDWRLRECRIIQDFVSTYGKYMEEGFSANYVMEKGTPNAHKLDTLSYDVLNMGSDFLSDFGFDRQLFEDDGDELIVWVA